MDFLSFSLNYWDDLWQSRHQIASALAREDRVLFVSPPFSLGHVLENFEKKNLPKSGLQQRSANLHTLVFPKWLFEVESHPSVNSLLASLRNRYIRRIIRKLSFRETILLIWNPRFVDLVGAFDEALSCYYVDDEFAAYAGLTEADIKLIRFQEDKLLSKADLVFANGRALLEEKNQHGNAINVPMTADFELFCKSRLPETVVSADLEAIPHPRIGYVGNVNDKVDFHLLAQIARARPSWSIVLVGPVGVRAGESRAEFEQLVSLPNAYSLGLKPREMLPSYIKGLDVCLMCYHTNQWARYIYPLKLHEYFASGKPVVGSAIASLLEFKDYCRIAQGPEEWIRSIEESLNENDPALREKRIQVAYENRLEERIRVIRTAIKKKLEEKKKRPEAEPVLTP